MQIGFVVKFTLGNQDGLQEFEAARPFDRLWDQGLSHQQRHSADKIAPRNGVIFQTFSLKNLFPDHFCSWFGKMNYICAQIVRLAPPNAGHFNVVKYIMKNVRYYFFGQRV